MTTMAPEMFVNETYYVEVTRNGDPLQPNIEFRKVVPPYLAQFPFPKDHAIRSFHQTRLSFGPDVTVELWRSTPSLVCCVRQSNGKLSVMP